MKSVLYQEKHHVINSLEPASAVHKLRERRKEGESLEDLGHMLDIDVLWTWFSISSCIHPRYVRHGKPVYHSPSIEYCTYKQMHALLLDLCELPFASLPLRLPTKAGCIRSVSHHDGSMMSLRRAEKAD